MTLDFDNGNPHPVSAGDRHTPKLDGDIYCSPACGGRCKKADFDQASERARILVAQLGSGWVAHVWENSGWHFEVKKGIASISLDENGRYAGVFTFTMSETNRVWMQETGDDPRSVISALSAALEQRIALLSRALLTVSFDPLEIESIPETEFTEKSICVDREQGGLGMVIDEPASSPSAASSDATSVLNKRPMTKAEMQARVKLLSDEMDHNEEENRDMQSEIDGLYKKIDALPPDKN